MEEKIMHLLITEDDMALAQGLQRALQEKNRQVLCCKNIQETRQHLHQNQTASAPEPDRSADSRCESAGWKRF